MGFLDSLLGRDKTKLAPPGQIENSALVRAMHEAGLNDTPHNRRGVHSALLASVLLVPVPEIPEGLGPRIHTVTKPLQLQLTTIVDNNNIRMTTAFTDVEALRNWDPNTPYLGVKALDLFRLLAETEIQTLVINPFDPIRKMIRPGGRVTRREIEMLASGVVATEIGRNVAEFRLSQGEKIFVGLPATPPSPSILDRLQKEAPAFPAITALYYFQIATERGGSHTVIGVEIAGSLTQQQRQGMIRSLVQAVRSELTPTGSLDFMFLDGQLGDQVRAVGAVIFRKA